MSKGYVVKGTNANGVNVYADEDHDGDIHCNPDEGTELRDGPCHSALDVAAGWRAEMVRLGCADVRVHEVAEDGTETPLPTYEEALRERGVLRAERDARDKAWARLYDANDDVRCVSREAARRTLRYLGVDVDALLSEARDVAEYACPDCGEDSRNAAHEGME